MVIPTSALEIRYKCSCPSLVPDFVVWRLRAINHFGGCPRTVTIAPSMAIAYSSSTSAFHAVDWETKAS